MVFVGDPILRTQELLSSMKTRIFYACDLFPAYHTVLCGRDQPIPIHASVRHPLTIEHRPLLRIPLERG